jgi:hypothetical protein
VVLSKRCAAVCVTNSNHVLDEIAVSGGIDDGEVELLGLELPQGNIDGDTCASSVREISEGRHGERECKMGK